MIRVSTEGRALFEWRDDENSYKASFGTSFKNVGEGPTRLLSKR